MDVTLKYRDRYRIPSARCEYHAYDGGLYFVTICTAGMVHSFGEVVDDAMHLNDLGQCVDDNIRCASEHYPYADFPLWVVMPNHVHVLIGIDGECDGEKRDVNKDKFSTYACGKGTLTVVVRGIKSAITRYANMHKIPFAWQARFHDRIVRNHEELNAIAAYIENNPAQWNMDKNP